MCFRHRFQLLTALSSTHNTQLSALDTNFNCYPHFLQNTKHHPLYFAHFINAKTSLCSDRTHCYSFSRLLWHIFPFTVYFCKTAHTQPLTEAEMTKTLYDVFRMTPLSQNLSHTYQNQTFPSKPTICAQLKMYVFSFI